MSSSFLALPPPCKPCSPPPTSSKNKKSSSRSSSRESSTRTISPKAKSLSHIGIFLPKTHNHRRRRAPSHYYHDYSSSFSSSYHHSESSSLSNDDEYHDAAISLAAHLLMRGHDVTIITASSSSYDRRPHGNNNNHEKKKKKTRQKNDLQRNAMMHRIGDMIKDHLPFCEGGGGGGDDDENLALVIDRLLIGVYDSPPSLDEEGDDDDEEDKIMLFLSSSSSSSDLPLDLSFSSVPPPSLSSSSSDKGGSLLRNPDLITMIEEQAKQPLHALVMDYTNVEVMLLAEHYRIPSLLLHHHHHHHLGNHQHLHGEMMIRNSKQLKSFILLSQADSNRRASSSSPASSTSSFLASSWWQSFMERVHTSWLDLQFGLVPFIRYNHLRQRCGLTILRRLLPDAWQASGAILVHLQQSTGPRITGDTTSTAMRAALPPKELPLLPVDNNRYDDDDIPNFISVQGPVIPPCFPCNENATDDTSPHPPCLIAASSSTATPLTSSTTKSVWSSWSTSSSSTTATTTSKKKKEKKKNIILWDDSLPYYYDSSSSSSHMARTMTESEHVVLNQLSHERKLLHALTLARDSLASWNHNRDDASNTLMNTTTTTATAEYNKTLSSLSDDFDIIRLEESERHRDSRNGGDLGVNSINNDNMSLLVGADQENRDLQPEFLKIHHVTTTFLDAISYYSHYSAKHHFQLILVMTNRCHDGHLHHHHYGASQSQQQDDKHDEKTDRRRHHQHWLESMDFPVLCVHDDAQETVRQLALRILRKLHQRDQVVQETAPTANTTTTNTASGKETATTQNNSTSTNSNKERQSPVWELVTLIEALAHVKKRPRIVWNTGRQLGAELLERVVVPWNNRRTSQYNNASTSWQPMSPLSPGATLGQPSHQPPPPLEVSMAWVILVLSIMYLFLRKVWLVRMSHRSGRSSQRLQQDDEQQRHDAHNGANSITNGTNIDSNTIDGLFSLLVQGTSRRLSHLDLALQLLQDWVNTELEKYHRSHTVASDAGAITANRDSTSEESGGGGVIGPRSRRKNAKKKNA